jgi:hypothetical protein
MRRSWGLCPHTPGIYRFEVQSRLGVFGKHKERREACLRAGFPPASDAASALGLLPSRALSSERRYGYTPDRQMLQVVDPEFSSS